VEFMGALFLIIYVGAIAVLFLFVVMMLNIKINNQISQSLGLSVLLMSLTVSIFLTKILGVIFGPHKLLLVQRVSENCFDVYSNLTVFGQVLYGYHILFFLLAGIVLLVAVIGAIILTIGYKKTVAVDLVSRQLARSANIIISFK
jgi:NADH-quinone oxidoreductase subunit J